MPSGKRCSKLLLSMGFSQCFHFDCLLEGTASQTWQGICHRWIFWYGDFWVLLGNAKWPIYALNFSSEWVSVSVFTLIVPSKVPPPKFDKEFVIGGYFGKGTFEYWWAMPSGQRCFKLMLSMGFSQCFLFDCPLESTTYLLWQLFTLESILVANSRL